MFPNPIVWRIISKVDLRRIQPAEMSTLLSNSAVTSFFSSVDAFVVQVKKIELMH
jgi:hypothetical protein